MNGKKEDSKFLLKAALALVVVIPLGWATFYFGAYIGIGSLKVRGHQEFAKKGLNQIQPAAEMDKIFEDCRHSIVYTGPESVSTWNSTAFFGERYQLTMQVPVEIRSRDFGQLSGKPSFYLNEIDSISISPSGGVGASFSSEGIEFGPAEWKRVFHSNGDFSAIGFTLKEASVPNFQRYVESHRPSK